MATSTLGVLALQGGYGVHIHMLKRLGHEVVDVRNASQLNEISGLVLPGGESTTQLRLIERFNLGDGLRNFVRQGHPVLATCAGVILLADVVRSPQQQSFGCLNIEVHRNGWGRQVASFEALCDHDTMDQDLGDVPLPLLFIRAPRITRVDAGVEVLARYRGEPVLVRQNNVFGATFHPELTEDYRVHSLVFGDRTQTS